MDATLVGPTGRTPLGAAVVTIGRAPDNQLVLSSDPKVSSHHAEIHPDGQSHFIVDLGSTNHTFVNEQDLFHNPPRRLQPGDVIRIGDTLFNYEVSNAQQNQPYVSDGSTMRAGNAGSAGQYGGTDYGTGYGTGPDAETYLKPQSSFYAPSSQEYNTPPAYPSMPPVGQPAMQNQPGQFPQSYDPTAYAFPAPATQQSQPPAQLPQQPPPSYPPPQYGNGGSTQNVAGGYGPNMPLLPQQPQQSPSPQKRRGFSTAAVLLVVLVFVVIIGSVGVLFFVHNNQVAASNSQATATTVAQATATQLAHAHATATFVTEFRNPYPPNTGTLALLDPLTNASNVPTFRWDTNANCQFQSGGYHVNESQQKTFFPCQAHAKTFTNFAYQATMTIISGDCGGLLFRSDDKGTNLYLYEVCEDATYSLIKFTGNNATTLFVASNPSPLLHQGLNQQNVLAVDANGSTIDLYANNQLLSSQSDAALSSGEIGMLAINLTSAKTDVAYQNARVWAL